MPVRIDNRTDYKRNHYVPECYLVNFTFNGKRCWILRDEGIFTNSISTIAWEYYLNSRDYEIFLGDNYEKTFSDCIKQMMLERRLLISGFHPNWKPGSWDFLFNFAAFMWSHNKYTREMIAQKIADDLNQKPEFSSVNYDIRCNDFYAKNVFESIKDDIGEWKAIIRMNDNQEFGFITSDNPCRVARMDEYLLKNINSPMLEGQPDLFANNLNLNYNVQVLDGRKIVAGEINVSLDNDSVLLLPLTHDMYLIMFKNHDASQFFTQETSFLRNNITHICNHLTYVNREHECYSKTENVPGIYMELD